MPNNDFPRILTLLRKERGFSQKKAAADLGISQALLSHYEKGVRECGLDFLVRAAAYYGVSCDYLLGRTPHRGAAPAGSPLTQGAAPLAQSGESAAQTQCQRLENSLSIVFGILEKIKCEAVTRQVSAYLSAAVYQAFRLLYSAREKNPQEAFSLDLRLYAAQAEALMDLSLGKARFPAGGGQPGGQPGHGPKPAAPLGPGHAAAGVPLAGALPAGAGAGGGGHHCRQTVIAPITPRAAGRRETF